MAGRKELIAVDPPLKKTMAHDFMPGVRGPSLSPWLQPPELHNKEKKPYLETDPAEEICRPSILQA
jgi:hypothetical protein